MKSVHNDVVPISQNTNSSFRRRIPASPPVSKSRKARSAAVMSGTNKSGNSKRETKAKAKMLAQAQTPPDTKEIGMVKGRKRKNYPAVAVREPTDQEKGIMETGSEGQNDCLDTRSTLSLDMIATRERSTDTAAMEMELDKFVIGDDEFDVPMGEPGMPAMLEDMNENKVAINLGTIETNPESEARMGLFFPPPEFGDEDIV